MTGDRQNEKPPVLGVRSLGLALAGHVVVFLLLYSFALLHLRPKESVIPIDLTVVVNENPDGEEHEPPPLSKTSPSRRNRPNRSRNLLPRRQRRRRRPKPSNRSSRKSPSLPRRNPSRRRRKSPSLPSRPKKRKNNSGKSV